MSNPPQPNSRRNKSVFIILAVAMVVLSLIVIAFRLMARAPNILRAGTWASVASLWSQMTQGDVLKTAQVEVNANWRRLSIKEYEAIIAELVKRRQVDVEQGELKNRQLLDPWSRPYEIALRKDQNQLQAVVWSRGPDRSSGTSDDIVYPMSAQSQLPAQVISQSE